MGQIGEKAAATPRAEVIETVQVLVPLHSPLHPVNAQPFAGLAVNDTTVLLASVFLQALPQLIPAGDDVTLPLPLLLTDST
ncbi:MAG: hypothetical protein OEM00_09815 [Burkholderiaceae bacterium]|nr:hypothetical protein [Burkholderiaceae bacterium]